ncbi:MAG: hypothetical protein JSR77_12465 [Planctomycetes bacterium]|nr:hypothetical protein [Planctomycetota bacterium]
MIDSQLSLDEIRAGKAQAEQLLANLRAAKDQTEASLAQTNRRDLFKRVTGASSIDNAIASATRMIEAYSRLIAEHEQAAKVA